MDFFDAQDRARRTTRRLVAAFIVATIIIVVSVTAIVGVALFGFHEAGVGYTSGDSTLPQTPVLVATAVLTTVFILGATVFKTAALSSGGGRVAAGLGGTVVPADTQDPLRRRLRNVVEEMAIASGVPVPEIYVLEEESGINAFAAGYTTSDAAIAVTRGALELLDRNELQGVIAHEFSHVLNGDMRLNIRLMGVLFGIMVLGLTGRMIVRGGYHTNVISSRRNRGTPVILVIGLGLVIVGSIGVLFARIIKAGVSRQREYLADASAVQFTRQSEGIANALKKIGGYSAGSLIQSADPEEVSHMLFGTGVNYSSLFATHPPLLSRIQALDPNFKATDYPAVDARLHRRSASPDATRAGFVGDVTTALASGGAAVLPESIAETVGKPENEHIEYAQHLRQSIPESLYAAAHSAEFAYFLTIALILDRTGRHVDRQLSLAREQLGSHRAELLRRYYDELGDTGEEFRLPLLAIAFPALKSRPSQELSYLVALATRMIEIDGDIDLYEYCFYRILTSNLGKAVDPVGRRRATRARRAALQAAAIDLIRVLASHGHDTDAHRSAAFAAGVAALGDWAKQHEFDVDRVDSVAILDRSLDVLLGLNSRGKEALVHAISVTAAHDHKLSVSEAELIRAMCATLNYPLPPILVHRDPSSLLRRSGLDE